MKHPYQKIIQLEISSALLGASIGIFAMIKGYYLLLLICFYFIAISFLCEAIVEWYLHNKSYAGKQLFRALILIVFITYLLLKL